MAIKWGERPGTFRRSQGNISNGYILTGTADRTVAYALSCGFSPVLWSMFYRTDVSVQEAGPQIWNVDVTWGPQDKKQPEPGDFSWSFDTTGGSKHITQSLATTARYVPNGKVAVDHKGTIGITEDGDVEGVDVIDRAFKWTENWKLLLGDFGWAYSDFLADMDGKINLATFRGKAAKTVRFDGATGGQSQKDPLILDLTFNFSHSKAGADLPVGAITVTTKAGWDYLWIEYQTEDGGAGKRLARRPIQANVEKVLNTADFSLFGIGTLPF